MFKRCWTYCPSCGELHEAVTYKQARFFVFTCQPCTILPTHYPLTQDEQDKIKKDFEKILALEMMGAEFSRPY